jgi:hypothetical protein
MSRERIRYPENGEKETVHVLKEGNILSTEAASQKDGLQLMFQYLQGERSFTEVVPTIITDLKRRENAAPLNVKKLPNGRTVWLNFNLDAYAAYKDSGRLLLLPQEDERFGYQWLDVYPLKEDSVIDTQEIIQSFRINQENKRFESQGWYGPDKQAFFDAVTGKVDAAGDDSLPEFRERISKNGNIFLGSIRRRNIKIHFDKPLQTTDSEVVVVPRIDSQRGYVWIEGYDPADGKRERQLFNRRAIDGENGIEILAWKGPEVQSLIDWMHGRLPLHAVAIVESSIRQEARVSNIYLHATNLMLQLGSTNINRDEPVQIIAHEDSLYKWLEVQQVNTQDSEISVVGRFQVEDREGQVKINGKWHGSQRQRLIDCLDGKIPPGELQDMEAVIGAEGHIYICTYHGRNVTLVARNKLFSEGDSVLLVPSVEEGNLIIDIYKPGESEVSKRYIFDTEKKNFTAMVASEADGAVIYQKFARKESGYWTSERIEGEARAFYEQEGELSQRRLASLGRYDLLNAVAEYPGKMTGLKRVLGIELRKKRRGYWTVETIEQEAMEFLEEYGTLTQKSMADNGKYGLINAISAKYPGGLSSLKKVLGLEVNTLNTESRDILPIEANKELSQFLVNEEN